MDFLDGKHRCAKRAYGGVVLGAVMGGFASVGNVLMAHGTKTISVLARDATVRQTSLMRSARTIAIMSGFSGLLQTTKCGLDEMKVKEPEYTAAVMTVCFAPWLPIAVVRAEMPWMLMLFGMDFYHTKMKAPPTPQ